MKTVIYENYGSPDVLRLKEVEKPLPKDDQVLVKIHSTSINAADWHLLSSDIFLVRFYSGLFKPKFQTLGADISGVVESVGSKITRFKKGDAVFGDLSGCGFGGLAEYVCAPEKELILKPATLSFDEAAALPMASITALQGTRRMGKIQKGEQVLINGTSGGVGWFALQFAKHFGAKVTAVCSTQNVEKAKSLGADIVLDYKKVDVLGQGKLYDVIIAVNGYYPISEYQKSLVKGGRYVMVGGRGKQMFQALLQGPFRSMGSGKKFGALTIDPKTKMQDLEYAADLAGKGKLKIVIDKKFPLTETAQAFRHLGGGHAKGKVVIQVAG